jgi:hypothetical protein
VRRIRALLRDPVVVGNLLVGGTSFALWAAFIALVSALAP